MENVELIGREFCSLRPRVKGFRSLVQLKLECMNRLSEWVGVEHGEFPRLEILSISSAFELRSLPLVPFSSLLNFNLTGSRNIVTVPASATLRELSIANCPNLNKLPALPILRSLKLFHCPSLVAFSHFPSLSVLHLEGPFKENTFYRLVNSHLSLEQLTVWSDAITSIHLEPQCLPSLMELELHCRNLEHCHELGNLSSLKRLYVKLSPRLQVPDSLRSQLEVLVDRESW
uniref:Uncharacterized protein n=1 Tax=Arundo donax TaxID=35708 RepID=A0A0A9A6A1_ARUDO